MPISLPLDPTARDQADDVFYCLHEDPNDGLVVNGQRRPLEATGTRDKELRREWCKLYSQILNHHTDGSAAFPECDYRGAHEHHPEDSCSYCPYESDPDAETPIGEAPDVNPVDPVGECPLGCEVLSIEWRTAETWCSDKAELTVTSKNCPDGTELLVEVYRVDNGVKVGSTVARLAGNTAEVEWHAINIEMQFEPDGSADLDGVYLNAQCEGKITPSALLHHLVPHAEGRSIRVRRGTISGNINSYTLNVRVHVEYLKGWHVGYIELDHWGYLLNGNIGTGYWANCWWFKDINNERHIWNGSEWIVPPFELSSYEIHGLGFYDTGSGPRCASDGSITYPETLAPWSTTDAELQTILEQWNRWIFNNWSIHFIIKRSSCESALIKHECCLYNPNFGINFKPTMGRTPRVVILSEDNVRAHSRLWPIGATERTVAHEYGHLIGLRDEYEGAANVDPNLNEDGAVNGIDPDSIMGSGNEYKKRHYLTAAKLTEKLVQDQTGMSFDYEPAKWG